MTNYSINKILVAVDLSEPSLNALHTALAFADKHNATLQILNVAEHSYVTENGSSMFFSRQANPDVLTALAGTIRSESITRPQLIQKKGRVVESIITTSITEQSDLIVMGTHGASGYREGFIGSNTYNVIKYATCPVLTIPPTRKFTTFKKALFPIRPVPGALTRYDVACNFLSSNATLQVLGLSSLKLERETDMLDKVVGEIREKLDSDKVKVITSWGKGSSISDDILDFARTANPELLILTNLLDAISKPDFIGPHAQKLIHCARVPVLNIKKVGSAVFA